MADGASRLLGEHDFSAFRAAGCDASTSVRRVTVSAIGAEGALISYCIEATAFLRHMVRNIVGTLVEVGRGRRAPADVERVLESLDRTAAGMTAPAHGLCLAEVKY
jgi:tRNA pseudouridine38-40 synthase